MSWSCLFRIRLHPGCERVGHGWADGCRRPGGDPGHRHLPETPEGRGAAARGVVRALHAKRIPHRLCRVSLDARYLRLSLRITNYEWRCQVKNAKVFISN